MEDLERKSAEKGKGQAMGMQQLDCFTYLVKE